MLQSAQAGHPQGRLHIAEATYLEVLREDGRHLEALHGPRVVHLQKGAFAEAEKVARRALLLRESAVLFGNPGNALKEGRTCLTSGRPAMRALRGLR